MIKIKIYDTDYVNKIEIKGHSGYAESGYDIVCASVSSMCITTVNGILKIDNEALIYEESDGYLLIDIKKNSDTVNKLIENLVDLLYELKKQYEKFIEIRRCHL